MKTKNMLVAAVLLSAAGLTAFSIDASADSDVTSGKTRAEVKAELAQARADGWRPYREEDDFLQLPIKSTKTRAQVKAELIQARQNGWNPSDYDNTSFAPPVKSTITRAEVKAELLRAKAEEASGRHITPDN